MAAYRAFREPALVSDPAIESGEFGEFESRRLRYAINWSFYENDAYRKVHGWSTRYKTEYGLYKHIRNIYNPVYRDAEFWKAHLWGGSLDPQAGDGVEVPSALPILTDNDAIRPAISQLWRWSNWQTNKDVTVLYGAVLGDAAIAVVDDALRGKVYLKFLHPGKLSSIEMDSFNNVKAYTVQEERLDPTGKTRRVVYREDAFRDGDDVVYQTYLNDVPYDWEGKGSEWVEPYGFIPLVLIQHNNVGLDWGWAEMHSLRSRVHEVDDLASKVSDYIRKAVDAPIMFAGINPPSDVPTVAGRDVTTARPAPGREEVPAFYGPLGATATPIVPDLDISRAVGHIDNILREIERSHPELQDDIWNAGGETSGRALRIARQRVESRVIARRANYDDPLIRAQQMAMAIGGHRGYFEGFSLDSYAAGLLAHSIGQRPVFAIDALDKLELEEAELRVELQREAVRRERAMGAGEV